MSGGFAHVACGDRPSHVQPAFVPPSVSERTTSSTVGSRHTRTAFGKSERPSSLRCPQSPAPEPPYSAIAFHDGYKPSGCRWFQPGPSGAHTSVTPLPAIVLAPRNPSS